MLRNGRGRRGSGRAGARGGSRGRCRELTARCGRRRRRSGSRSRRHLASRGSRRRGSRRSRRSRERGQRAPRDAVVLGRQLAGRRQRGAHRQVGLRRARRERARIDVIEGQRGARERHRAERRGLHMGAPGQLHPGSVEVEHQRLERTRQRGMRVDLLVRHLARITGRAGDRERARAVEPHIGRQRAERRIEPLQRERVMASIALAVREQLRQLGGRARLVDAQRIEAQLAQRQLQRKIEILRQRGGRGLGRRRHDRHVDGAGAQVVEREAQRRARERPAPFHMVDPHLGALAAGGNPGQLRDPHALGQRTALQRAREPPAQHRHGRLPGQPRAALGHHRRGQRAGQQHHHQQQHAGAPGQRAAEPARPARRRLAGLVSRRRRVVRRWRGIVLGHAGIRKTLVRMRCRASGRDARCDCAGHRRGRH